MKIEFDTTNLTDLDRVVLSVILGTDTHGVTPPPAAEQPAPAKPVKKAAAAKILNPETVATAQKVGIVEPEVPTSEEASPADEDLLAPADSATPEAPAQPTMQDAVAAATPLIAGGKQNEVKAILQGFGVKRVSGLSEDQIPAFLDGIEALKSSGISAL